MQIEGRTILVLGGGGMVGVAVCRELLPHTPARVAVAARRELKARRGAEQLSAAFPDLAERIVPVWGDVFLRAEWQQAEGSARDRALADAGARRRLVADILEPLDEDILHASLLYRMVVGSAPGLDGRGADIVIDCMNTATAVGYQDIYAMGRRLADLAATAGGDTDWPGEVEALLAALSVPQLVRHVQLLYRAMREAGTRAYLKVGTSGTGGMGFNIPYTHGEERPSRLLLSKAALAGAQTLLTFLMARTPDAPPMVREIKPTAMIGWHEIGWGPIRRRGMEVPLYDCAFEDAVSAAEPFALVPEGDFGVATGKCLEGVHIDTGENGLFSADEFAAITTLGQMQLVTPEDVARNLVDELLGRNTGRDVVAALDGSATGPSYRGGMLRQSALTRLRQLERERGQAVAFEILGPPRLSKLLYEAYLLKTAVGGLAAIVAASPEALAAALAQRLEDDPGLRSRIVSIGIAILLPDGARLLRGPVMKAEDAHHGWIDLTPANMRKWQERLGRVRETIRADLGDDTSSRRPRIFAAGRDWSADEDDFEVGEVAGWIFLHEEAGERAKG